MYKALRALILTADSVKGVVPETAVRWNKRVGRPAVALFLIDGPRPGLTMDGADALEVSLVQVECWGATFEEAAELADPIRKLLHGFRTDGVLHLITVEGGGGDDDDLEGPVADSKPTDFHRIRIDLRVRHINS